MLLVNAYICHGLIAVVQSNVTNSQPVACTVSKQEHCNESVVLEAAAAAPNNSTDSASTGLSACASSVK